MAPTDRPAFAQAITALAASFRSESDEAMLEGYWWALDDLQIEDVRNAVRMAMRQCKFMPAAVELRDLAGGMTPATRAMFAWSALEKTVSRHGAYETVNFDDVVINATIRNLGGWLRCCDLPAEEFDKWFRKDFERVYQAFLQSGVSPEAGSPLIGIYDQENYINGYGVRQPLLIETSLPKHPTQIAYENGRQAQIAYRSGEPKQIGEIIDSANKGV